MASSNEDEQVQRRLAEQERKLAEIELRRREAALKERSRQEKLALARLEQEREAERHAQRLVWAKQSILNEMARADPFSYSDGGFRDLDEVSDLRAELWLQDHDKREQEQGRGQSS